MPDKRIDSLDIKIIRLLQQDARTSFKEIASHSKTSYLLEYQRIS